MLSMPLFSLLYFCLSWAFVAFFVMGLIYHTSKAKEQSFDKYEALGHEDDDLKSFLS